MAGGGGQTINHRLDYFDLEFGIRAPPATTPPLLHPPSTSPSPGEVMSRPLTQLLPPDLPAGATSPQFGVSNPAGSGPQGGHLTSMTNLKSLLQLPIKADQRSIKDSCEMKGERARAQARTWMDVCVRARERNFLKGQWC